MEREGKKVGRESRWTAEGLPYSDAVGTTASTGSEWLFVGMGLTGVFVYQFLENCAIYYTNASNVAILVSFGPIVTAVFAQVFTKDRSLSFAVVGGSLIAVCGVVLVSLNGVLNFNMRPFGDLLALGAMTSWGVYSVLIETVCLHREGIYCIAFRRVGAEDSSIVGGGREVGPGM